MFSAADLFSFSFEIPFYEIAILLVAATAHNFRSDSFPRVFVFAIPFLFRRIFLKVLWSARFILSVTGNRTYSEFLFHPIFISIKIITKQYCYCFCGNLLRGAWLLKCFCVSKGLRIHLHESFALCQIFPPVFHFSFLFTLTEVLVLIDYSACAVGWLAAHFVSSPKIGAYFENWFRKQKVFSFRIALLLSFF